MEKVIRKLFSASTYLRAQHARMSQEEVITFRFGPCLKRSPHNHDNVDPQAQPPSAEPPTQGQADVVDKALAPPNEQASRPNVP